MDSVAQVKPTQVIKDTVYSKELISIFESYADTITVLSLDCFDTLLFRKTATPADVFYDLQHSPTFKKLGFTPLMRTSSESRARKLKAIRYYQNEVTLRDIYLDSYPDLSADTLNQLEEEELAAEIDACYAFAPIFELIRAADAKNIKVIIVSDTYFKSEQLKRLLATHLPSDVLNKIDTIFCSSEFNRTKGFGLFKMILAKLSIHPSKILHIGDNHFADVLAPRREKMHSVHFSHFNENIHELLRMQAITANLFDNTIRNTRALYSPFNGMFANRDFSGRPEELIGYASLGPILYAFGQFIISEIAELKKLGKNPKIAFLMRDAYLPSKVVEALGEASGKCISISRFASIAASFRTQNDVDQYLLTILGTGRLEDILRQLLIPKDKASKIIAAAKASKDPQRKFIELIHQPEMLRHIYQNSVKYFNRLQQYLKNELDLQLGDTLVLIDLGYTGTTHKLLAPIFKKEQQIEVVARYLISLYLPGWDALSRRGLIDASWCDSRSMHALVLYIALFEQLCTSNTNSVIDYTEEGAPIFSESKIGKQQQVQLESIQEYCLQFIRDASTFFKSTSLVVSPKMLRETAMAELGRLLFFPTETEVRFLETFEFESNLGTTDLFRIYDQQLGISSLRHRGIFSAYMEKHGSAMRLNRPAEMRAAGLELAMMLFSHHRFGLQLKKQDATLRKESLEVVVIQNNHGSHIVLDAVATFDGFYAVTIPVGAGNFQVGLLFGKKYVWLEFGGIQRIDARAFLTDKESLFSEEYFDRVTMHQLTKHSEKLFECQTLESLVLIPAVQPTENTNKYIMRIVFRPIVFR